MKARFVHPGRVGLPVFTIFLCLSGVLAVRDLHAQDLVWASRAGGAGLSDQGFGAVTDVSGHVFVAGSVDGTATFGEGTPRETIVTGNGNRAVLAKYTAGGALLWVVQGAGHGDAASRAFDVATDRTGNAYVTGFFRGAVTFGAGEEGETELVTSSPSHGFIAIYDTWGRLTRAIDVGGTASASFRANSITVAPGGSIYVTGAYAEGASLDGDARDAFVAKYASNGALLWMNKLGHEDDGLVSEGREITTDPAGYVYVTGTCAGTSFPGGGGPSCEGSFVARYDPAGTLQWARTEPGTANSLAVEASSALYTTGSFVGTVTFGAGEANETTLTASGRHDAYLARYAADGSLHWVRRAGGTYDTFEAEGRGIAVALGGNVYLTGAYWNDIVFGAGEANETRLTSHGFSDVFVSKFNPEGAVIWVGREGGPGVDEGEDIAVDEAGRVFITGRFQETATFGEGEEQETVLTSAGSWDLFAARVIGTSREIGKSDLAPNLAWAKQATAESGFSYSGSADVVVDADGQSYVVGYFLGEVTFGAGQAGETTLVCDRTDHFVAAYDAHGALRWVKHIKTESESGIQAVALDPKGHIVVVGAYSTSITFGKGEANETTLTSSDINLFIASYRPDGSLSWARGAAHGAGGFAVDVDDWGNIYVTGSFERTATFGPTEPRETVLTSAGERDLFLAKFRPEGTLDWVTRAMNSQGMGGDGIAVDAQGRIFITGYFWEEALFGPGEPGESYLSRSTLSMFVARYRPDGTLAWVRSPVGEAHGCSRSYGIALDASGHVYVTGSFQTNSFFGGMVFGADEANETTLTTDAVYELFVARYALDGSLDWVTQTHGDPRAGARGTHIEVDPSGNSLIAGALFGPVTFGRGEAQETTLFSDAWYDDLLVAKYDAGGALVWVRHDGGAGNRSESVSGLDIDAANNVYVTGGFEVESAFGINEPDQTILVSQGSSELFVARYEGDHLGSKADALQDPPVALADAPETGLPARFALDANYPNPFNPTTTIRFHLDATETPAHLEVYDVTGRRVRTLVAGMLPAGVHEVVWDGRDEGGRMVSSGVYAYRLQAGARILTRTMTLVK